jgi:hypothetical protein
MSELRFDFDQEVWIGVPIDWQIVPDATARGWATWVANTLAEDVPGPPDAVEALVETLARIGESQAADENRFVFLPDVWSAPSMISVRAAVSQRDVPLAEIAGADSGRALEHHEKGIRTRQLGKGLRSLRHVEDADGVMAILVYAFRAHGIDIRVAASDYDLARMAKMVPYADEFVRTISVQ